MDFGAAAGICCPDVSRRAVLFQKIFNECKIYQCGYSLSAPVALPEGKWKGFPDCSSIPSALGHAQELLGIMARVPGGQMQGDATQAMRCHRRGSTKQMPARRRATSGCGPQARWRCCSLLTYSPAWLSLRTQFSSLASSQRAWGPAAKCLVILAHALSSPIKGTVATVPIL